ncbi:MAG: hypothetical protein RL021_1513 [Bacteroidota bacterium]
MYKSALLVLLLFACNRHQPAPEAVQGTVKLKDAETFLADWSRENSLVVLVSAEPKSLHPVSDGSDALRSEIFLYLHRKLLRSTGGMETEPDLLNAPPVPGPDPLTYSFQLKNDLRWDDGTPVTAADVLFTCKVNACPAVANTPTVSYWNRVRSIETAPDDKRRFTINYRNQDLLNTFFLAGFPILERDFHDPEHVLDEYSFEQLIDTSILKDRRVTEWADRFNDGIYGHDPEHINGLGDYLLTDWSNRENITLSRKTTADPVQPEKIIYRFGSDETSTLLELRRQTYDVSLNGSLQLFFKASADEQIRNNYHCILSPTYNVTYCGFNERPDSSARPAYFIEKKVRHAFRMLMPLHEILQQLFGTYVGSVRTTGSHMSPYRTECDTTLPAPKFDPVSAIRLLKEAGWTDHDKDGLLDRNGIVLSPQLTYVGGNADWNDIATVITANFRKFGIDIRSDPCDPAIYRKRAMNHDFDLLLGTIGGNGSLEDYSQWWSTASWQHRGNNYTGFGNQSTDLLIDSINAASLLERRIKMSHRMQRIIHEDCPYVFLYNSVRRNIISRRWSELILFPERPGLYLNRMRLLPS